MTCGSQLTATFSRRTDRFPTRCKLVAMEFVPDSKCGSFSSDTVYVLRLTDVRVWQIQSGTQTMALVNSLCYMLATTPFQRENYSRLIIGIIVQYYQKSNSHYKGEHHLSKASSHLYLRDLVWQTSLPRTLIPMDAYHWPPVGASARISSQISASCSIAQ